LLCSFFVLLLLLFASPVTRAQTNDAEQKGFPVDGVFHSGDVDTVNVQNGNLHIAIPLVSLKQRGGSTVTYQLVYDTQAWEKLWIPNNCGHAHCSPTGSYLAEVPDNSASGWRFMQSPSADVGFMMTNVICPYSGLTYEQYTNWSVVDPQGGSHPLSLRQEVGATFTGQTFSGPTLDGSGYTYDIPSGTVRAKNGTILLSTTQPVTDGSDLPLPRWGVLGGKYATRAAAGG
jgi:hypothetical protein